MAFDNMRQETCVTSFSKKKKPKKGVSQGWLVDHCEEFQPGNEILDSWKSKKCDTNLEPRCIQRFKLFY